MSVRAYRIAKIELEECDSFNLWRDTALNDELRNNGYYDNLNEGGGIFEISISALKEIITDIENTLSQETIENLRNDIKATEDIGEEYIQYYCY